MASDVMGGRTTKGRLRQNETGIRLQAMWPTPNASLVQDGEEPETWLARREVLRAKGINGNGAGMPLTIAAKMLPTPRHEGFDAGAHQGKPDSLHAYVKMLPTPRGQSATGPSDTDTRQGGMDLQTAVLLPTPTATTEHVSDMATQSLSGQQRAKMRAEGVPFISSTGGMKLNPDWVSRMMGYPDTWLDIPTLDGTTTP